MNDPPVPELGGYDPDRYDGWTLVSVRNDRESLKSVTGGA